MATLEELEGLLKDFPASQATSAGGSPLERVAREQGLLPPTAPVPEKTTPIPTTTVGGATFGPTQRAAALPGFGAPGEGAIGVRPLTGDQVTAAKAGVRYDNPAPSGQFAASFGHTQRDQLLAYQIALGSGGKRPEGITGDTRLAELEGRKPVGVPVRVGPDTGEIEWFDEELGWSLANPSRQIVPNIKGFGADALRLQYELAFGAAGAIGTRSPLLTVGSEAFGAAMGEMAVILEGQRMGLNRDMTPEDIAKEAVKAGGTALAFGYGAAKTAALVQFFSRIISGQPTARMARNLLDLDDEEATALEAAVNNRLNADKLRYSFGERTNDEELLQLQDFYKRSTEWKKEFGEFSQAQTDALREFYNTVNEPFKPTRAPGQVGTLDDEEALRRVIGVADNKITAQLNGLDRSIQHQRAEMNHMLASLDDRPYESIGGDLRSVGADVQREFTQWANKKAAQLHRISGGGEIITNRNTVSVVNRLNKKAKDALFPLTETGTRRLLPKEPIVDPETGETLEIGGKVFDPDAKFTFAEAWEALSGLKRMERVAAKGLSTEAPEVAAIQQLRGALEHDIRNSLQNTRMGTLYDKFVRAYAINKKRLDEGSFGAMMERVGGPNGRFELRDEAVFRNFWVPGDRRRAQELHDVISDRPVAMDAMRRAIVDDMKRRTTRGGVVQPEAHTQYMKQHKNQLGLFFTKDEIGKMNRVGGAEKALQARAEARDRAVKRINQSFEGRIANLNDPGKLLLLLRDETSASDARKLVGMLRQTPDVLRGLRRAYINNQIANKLAGRWEHGERILSVANFDQFLHGKGQGAGQLGTIKALFGEQYAKDMVTLNKALKVASRESRFPNRSNTAFWLDTTKNLTRAYVGLFTRSGRILTALDRLRGKAAARVISRAIMNPDSLRKLMELRGRDLRTQKAMGLIGAMGGSALFATPDEVEAWQRGVPFSMEFIERSGAF